MSIRKINYTRPARYLGRNGGANSGALELMTLGNPDKPHLSLTPFNKKDDRPGKCFINIPIENLPELIEALQAMYEENQGHPGHVRTLIQKIEEYLYVHSPIDEQECPPVFPTVEGGTITTTWGNCETCTFLLEEDELYGGVLVTFFNKADEFLRSVPVKDLTEAEAQQILNDPEIQLFFQKNI